MGVRVADFLPHFLGAWSSQFGSCQTEDILILQCVRRVGDLHGLPPLLLFLSSADNRVDVWQMKTMRRVQQVNVYLRVYDHFAHTDLSTVFYESDFILFGNGLLD